MEQAARWKTETIVEIERRRKKKERKWDENILVLSGSKRKKGLKSEVQSIWEKLKKIQLGYEGLPRRRERRECVIELVVISNVVKIIRHFMY